MDFVVSKVAMSVCALMVVSVLGGILEQDLVFGGGSELETIVKQFCSLADRALMSGSDAEVGWTVPSLADGTRIELRVEKRIVTGEADGERSMTQPMSDIHTWTWDGRALNDSTVDKLDDASAGIIAMSGESVALEVRAVMLENEPKMLLFVFIAV